MGASTSVAIQALERMGYVERRQRGDNLKKVYVHLTKAGRALEARLVPLAVDVNEAATKGISQNDINVFRKTLMKIIK